MKQIKNEISPSFISSLSSDLRMAVGLLFWKHLPVYVTLDIYTEAQG